MSQLFNSICKHIGLGCSVENRGRKSYAALGERSCASVCKTRAVKSASEGKASAAEICRSFLGGGAFHIKKNNGQIAAPLPSVYPDTAFLLKGIYKAAAKLCFTGMYPLCPHTPYKIYPRTYSHNAYSVHSAALKSLGKKGGLLRIERSAARSAL